MATRFFRDRCCCHLLWTVVQNEDDSDDDESDSDDEVAAVRAQQTAAQFGWFDDMFIFDTGKLCSCNIYVLIFHSFAVTCNIWKMYKKPDYLLGHTIFTVRLMSDIGDYSFVASQHW